MSSTLLLRPPNRGRTTSGAEARFRRLHYSTGRRSSTVASAISVGAVAVQPCPSDTFVGAGGLFNLCARTKFLKFFLGPFDAFVKRVERRLDVLALLLQILDLVARFLQRKLELGAMSF